MRFVSCFSEVALLQVANVNLRAGDLIQWTGKILEEITEGLGHKGDNLIWVRRNEKGSQMVMDSIQNTIRV